MKSPLAHTLGTLLLAAASLEVSAHQGSTSYLSLIVEEDRVRGRWDIPVRDLDLALRLDADADQKVSMTELTARFAELQTFALPHLKLSFNGAPAVMLVTNQRPVLEQFADGASTALDFVVTNVVSPTNLVVEHRFLLDPKPADQAFMQVECRGVTQTGVFTKDEPIQRFDLRVRNPGHEFRTFAGHGVWHIWIGLDHILFLLALLLPAVLRREQGQWQAAASFGEAFVNVFKVVTAFTVAHSITLSLAALQILSLPSRWVESAIAGSVVVAAGNNLYTVVRGRVWLVAFAFGLIHGFGFASVLTDLGLPRHALLVALLGFNLGVEAGQLVIVLLFLPVAFAWRNTRAYRSGILKVGSILIIVVAAFWLVERLFDLKLVPW